MLKLTEPESKAAWAEKRLGRALAKPKPLSEAQIQRQILDMLKCHPSIGYVSRVNVGGVPLHGRGQQGKFRPAPNKGMSDIIGVLKGGRFLAVEVKSAKGKLSPDQRNFLDSIEQSGGLAVVARSVETVKEILRESEQ